jgi:hypothetical protein
MSGMGNGAAAKGTGWIWSGGVLWLLLALALPASGRAQQTGTTNPYPAPHGFPPQDGSPYGGADQGNSVMMERRLRMINAERQKELVTDTDKLLALATALSSEIAKSNTGALTPEQIRKVAEVEKLAHSVRDKMAMSLRSNPMMNMDSPPFWLPPR